MKKISLVLSLLASVLLFSCESEEDKVGPCEAYEPFDFEVVVTNNDDYAWDFEMWYIEMMKEDFLMECVAEVSTRFEDGTSQFEASTGETIRKKATGAGINGRAEVRFRANVLDGGEVVTTVSDGEVLYFTIDGNGDLSMTSSGGDYNNPGNTNEEDDQPGSGFGSLVFYVPGGGLVTSGYSIPECDGWNVVLKKSGSIVAEGLITELQPADEIFCGIHNAVTFENLPAGMYEYEIMCGDEIVRGVQYREKKGSVEVIEDECKSQRV